MRSLKASARAGSRGRRWRASLRAWPQRDVWIACAFLVLCFFLGGRSRFQLGPHVALRLISVAAVGYALWRMTPADRARTRPFALAVIAFGGLMVMQLVPLPPAVWAALPGHGFYHEALHGIALADRWRPLSMSPDLTLNSLLALFPVLAAAMLFAPLDVAGRRRLLDILLACIVIDALVSILQLVSGAFYPYPVTNQGAAVGLFANRNHHALLLAIGIVLVLGRWRMAARRGAGSLNGVLVLGAIAMIFTLLIVAGSRGGLLAGMISFLVGGSVLARGVIARRTGWQRFAIPAAGIAIVALAFGIGMTSTRQVAVQRLLETGSTIGTTELRTANLPALFEAIRTFFPLGSGFGTFDAVFRRFESDALLRPTYFNHAHNEPIEVLIEGGIPAAILLAAALLWLVRCGAVLLVDSTRAPVAIWPQIGIVGLSLLLIGSMADYPMRAPFLAVVAMLLATWAAEPAEPDTRDPEAALGTVEGLG